MLESSNRTEYQCDFCHREAHWIMQKSENPKMFNSCQLHINKVLASLVLQPNLLHFIAIGRGQ